MTKRLFFSASLAALACATALVTAGNLSAQEEEVASNAPEPTKLLRYPDVYQDQVVFCYAGDLWKSDFDGSQVTRLTAHPGQEEFPKFSPDGKWIAFTGQYDGDDQVYVIPSQGGEPKRLTYYPNELGAPRRGVDAQTLGWTPDSQFVLFRSKRDSDEVDSLTNIYLVSKDGGLPEKIGVPVAGAGDLSPDGQRLVYSPLFRDFRHWKRYEGGWAQYLLIYNRETKEFSEIPTTPRTDRDPMWLEDQVYFVSDRDGTMNVYHYVPENEEKPVQKVTDSTDWDIRWASSDGHEQIVYEYAGALRVYNASTGDTRELEITVPHDGLAARPTRLKADSNMESYGLSPEGKRALFTARGDIFTVPVENGKTRNLTNSSNAHERSPIWSSDGRWIAFISDETGEDQVYVVDQKGENDKVQLTNSLRCKIDDLRWSPDCKAMHFRDAMNRLWVLKLKYDNVAEAPQCDELIEIARDKFGSFPYASWSPDGRYLAYELGESTEYTAIYIWDKTTGESKRVTDPMFQNSSPAWSTDGNWLFFIGQREFYPQFSSIEWNFAGDRFDGIFAMALRKDVDNIFIAASDEAPESEEVKKDEETDDNEQQEAEKTAESDAKEIDFDGIESRVVRLPIPSENYVELSVAGDFLYFIREPEAFYGRDRNGVPKLMAFELSTRKLTTFIEDFSGYSLSADGKKLLTHKAGYRMYDVGAQGGDSKVFSTGDMYCDVNPREEWNEVFEEVWRRFRDYFYVKNMHGLDWDAVGEQYRSLLPYVSHRSDLTYLLTEMIGELNIGHTYVDGGDYVKPERPTVGLPGATFELDREKNLYRIAKIYKGHNEEPKYRSPLTEVGVNASQGDYVLAIDGVELLGSDNPYRLLQNKDSRVELTLSKDGDYENSWKTSYEPVTSEESLRYLDFVLDRMRRVEEASDGRLGYLHIPDMGGNGAYEFIKWYYPQLRKEGIVIDERSNGGGNISPWIIMRLNQKLLGTRYGRVRETPTTYPTISTNAKFVCLLNETSASDGDIFPYYFRKSGLGKLIGKRSWGGVVGISGRGPLLDGGSVFVPLSATNSETGEYVIEGHGVDPDIEVWQDPQAVLEGRDPQLERGIEELLKEIEENPATKPQRPEDPMKDKANVPNYDE
ncbi:MAG: S41 family peptidase [Planctomycetia bacterium]|nr:S41 family peptidase [Planctomycetia bacterium]